MLKDFLSKSILLCGFLILFAAPLYSQVVTVAFAYEPAVQHFVVPPGVTNITVSVTGAQGGGSGGGNGASFKGICMVSACEVLSIAVGQQGGEGRNSYSGGGGGASWVYDSNIVLHSPSGTTGLFAVAGGGGGGAYNDPFSYSPSFFVGGPGGNNLLTNVTTAGSDTAIVGGIDGNGGGADNGGGGAGWLSNGENGGYIDSGGMDEANYFRGVMGHEGGGLGGFGGGGGGNYGCDSPGCSNYGGGGGGYNGGGGGFGGGGGGSYLNGTLLGIVTATNMGNGSVTISYQQPIGIIDYPCNSPEIGIYPNPTTGVFVVTGVTQGQTMEMYNYLGQKISTVTITSSVVQLSLSTKANGVYLVVVHNTNGSIAGEKKVVKMQ